MEEGVRSDGVLVKKKNSSGCLIIKKTKGGNSSLRKVSESNSNKKKRPRLILSDSEASEEETLEAAPPLHRKVVLQTNSTRNGDSESERKRRLDVFEFDEYDNIDEKRMKKKREFDTCLSRHVAVGKRKDFVKLRNSSGGKRDVADCTVKSKLKIEDDNVKSKLKIEDDTVKSKLKIEDTVKSKLKFEDIDGDLPLSSLRQKPRSPPNEAIRLQGKNGVLKITANKMENMETPKKFSGRQVEIEERKVSKSEKFIKKKKLVGPSFYSELKVKMEERELKVGKKKLVGPSFNSELKVKMEERELKVGKPTVIEEARSPSKVVKKEKVQAAKKITPAGGSASAGKIERGSGTEKQLLREKLKKILVSAGWKIDYRPRRSRDYLDAVYISPTGTAYWSIVKAYDAFRKHKEDDVEGDPGGDSSMFNSLSEDIKKLTRNTQKKIQRDMKIKRKENKSKNSKRVSMEESNEDSDGDNDEDDKTKLKIKKTGKLSKETDDRKAREMGRCSLLVRRSDKGLNSQSEGYIPYTGKRTFLSWLIDSGKVNSSEKVKYMNRKQTRVMLEGWVTRGGIHCGCCSKVLSISKFEIHAGSKLRQPYQNIYLESGVSLLQCQVDAWNGQEGTDHSGFHSVDVDGDDPDDDTCIICGDGGDLICCDGCPSTFHQNCLDIEMLPPGDWLCPNCTCKFCGLGGVTSAVDNGTAADTMLTCGLCEKKYHKSCGQEVDASSNLSGLSSSFCGPKCYEIFDSLQKLLGFKHELDTGFTWSLIHRSDLDTDPSHRSFPQRVEANSKLAVALSVMDECFLPVIDRRSGINIVNSVLYNCGSNFSRLNYSGFYSVILEKGDEIVAAATIRIRGTQLAEMPFIGTRHIYRRQGMCRRLLGAIEALLGSLGVEKLMIPSIAEHMHTWTTVFDFKPLNEPHKQELRSMNMVVFPGVAMLQKFLVKRTPTDGEKTGEGSIPLKDHHHLTPNTRKSCPVNTSDGHGLKTGDDSTLYNDIVMSEKSADVVPSLPDSVVPSNGPMSDANKLDAILPSSLHPKDGHDAGTAGDLNQLDAVSLSSPSNCDRPEPGPVSDLKQPDAHETESKLNEAVEVSEPVVLPDSKPDSLESDKTAADSSISACDPATTEGSKDNVNRVRVSTQNGVHEETESHVDFVVPSEAVVKTVENCSRADGDGSNGCDLNGEVGGVELPCQSKDISGDEVPLSVSGTDGEETNPKLRSRADNEMGGNTHEVNDINCPVGPVLDSTPVESAQEELKESNAA